MRKKGPLCSAWRLGPCGEENLCWVVKLSKIYMESMFLSCSASEFPFDVLSATTFCLDRDIVKPCLDPLFRSRV